MVYVDLNPIRAAMAKTPEASDYTSIQERIHKNSDLIRFANDDLPFLFTDYLKLAETTARIIIETKRGYIPTNLPDILQRLNLNSDTWLEEFNQFKTIGITAVGTVAQLKDFCLNVGKL